mmetsp:Transcript_5904/g.10834  ORF Transcript_5904/g.10834 Transcript_5904/m.10834 type:complete len:714 (+) Transcript_5904:2173-4314(+)
MLLNHLLGQWPVEGSRGLGLTLVDALHELVETKLHQHVLRQENVVAVVFALPLDLVLVVLLHLLTGHQSLDHALLALELDGLLHQSLLFLGQLQSGLHDGLTILVTREPPLHVQIWGLVQMVLNVVERVLGNVGETHVRVLLHSSFAWNQLTTEQLNHGRLTCTVGTHDSDTGHQRHEDGHVRQNLTSRVGISEPNTAHLQQRLGLGLDTLQETRIREPELQLGAGLQLIVLLGLRVQLDEGRQVTLVLLQLQSVEVDDVVAHTVQEARAVGHSHHRHVLEVDQVVLHPSNIPDVQVIGRLVQQQDISTTQDGTAQGKLHSPTSRQMVHGAIQHGISEIHTLQHWNDLIVEVLVLQVRVKLHEINHIIVGELRRNVRLQIHGSQYILRWESLHLSVGDRPHQGRLTTVVTTAETITSTTLQAQLGLVQENLVTVSQGELTVAQIFTLLIVLLLLFLGHDVLDALLDERGRGLISLVRTQPRSQEGSHCRGPVLSLVLLVVNQVTSVLDNKVESDGGEVGGGETGSGFLQQLRGGVLVSFVHSLLGLLVIQDAVQSGVGLAGGLTALWVRHVVHNLVVLRLQLSKEGGGCVGIVNQLHHVVRDHRAQSLHRDGLLAETSDQQWHHNRETRWFHNLNESGSCQLVHAVRHFSRLGDSTHHSRNKGLNVSVANGGADLEQGVLGSNTDILLGVPHALRSHRNNLGEDRRSVPRGLV